MSFFSKRIATFPRRIACGALLLAAMQVTAQADDLPPAVAPSGDATANAPDAALDDGADPLLDEELLRELSADSEEAMLDDLGLESEPGAPIGEEMASDPLAQLSGQMRTVEERLASGDATDETLELQAEIVGRLDELIEELRRQQSQQQQSQGQQTGQRQNVEQPEGQPNAGQAPMDQPASESTDQLVDREVEPPDPAALDALIKDVWGDLPLRVRQQLMQSYRERYLPKYELEIIEYFRTLVERPQQP